MKKLSARDGLAGGAAFLLCISAGVVAPQDRVRAGGPAASFARASDPASVPFGWVDFCRRYIGECDPAPSRGTIALTARTLGQIQRINGWVNSSVQPVSDAEQWSMVERWDYPTTGKGDCEDYVLLKRRLLIEAGFPRSALLVTIVKDSHELGHALLTVKTDAGEFVLDNLTNEIKLWDQSGYRFVKRQSEEDQNAWVQIGDSAPGPDYVAR